jgi:2-dehydropantoate 2-reductase
VRIAVVGAGGVGGYYAAALARGGHAVRLLARGAHLGAIVRQGGIRVRTATADWLVDVGATDDPAALDTAELVLVSVKSYSLDEVAGILRDAAARGAALLPLLNGVDAADRLAALGVPRHAVVGATTYIIANRTEPGLIVRSGPPGRIVLGDFDPDTDPRRSDAIATVLRSSDTEVDVSTPIAGALWRKFSLIAPMAAACGLTRAAVGPMREAPYGRLLLERATREVVDVAQAVGVPLGAETVARTGQLVDALAPTAKPSFLLDVERGGPTEVDLLSGTVARLGRRVGIETPIHDAAVAAFSRLTGAAARAPLAAAD